MWDSGRGSVRRWCRALARALTLVCWADSGASIAAWRRGEGGVRVLDPLLAARVRLLAEEAPSFARALGRLEASGVPILVGTREQLAEVLPPELRTSAAWAGITVARGGGRLDRAAVAIRPECLRELHRSFGNSGATFLEVLDGLLIHEIYGHLLPTVEAGDARVRCPDPVRGQRLADSGVGRRPLALASEREANVAARFAARQRRPGRYARAFRSSRIRSTSSGSQARSRSISPLTSGCGERSHSMRRSRAAKATPFASS